MGLLGFLILLLLQSPGPFSCQRREGILALLALHIPEELASSLFLAPGETREEAEAAEGLCPSQSGQVK